MAFGPMTHPVGSVLHQIHCWKSSFTIMKHKQTTRLSLIWSQPDYLIDSPWWFGLELNPPLKILPRRFARERWTAVHRLQADLQGKESDRTMSYIFANRFGELQCFLITKKSTLIAHGSSPQPLEQLLMWAYPNRTSSASCQISPSTLAVAHGSLPQAKRQWPNGRLLQTQAVVHGNSVKVTSSHPWQSTLAIAQWQLSPRARAVVHGNSAQAHKQLLKSTYPKHTSSCPWWWRRKSNLAPRQRRLEETTSLDETWENWERRAVGHLWEIAGQK